MRKTISTLVQMGRSSSKANSKRKFSFCLALFFLFALTANQLQAQCSISCNNVNISVGQSCEADVHWTTLATLPMACNPMPADSNFTLIVRDMDNGSVIAESDSGNIVVDLSDYLNDSVTWEVYYDNGTNNNWCWTNTLVEDKMPPQIECANDTVVCLEMFNEPFPTATDNCTAEEDIQIIVRNRTYVPICDDNFLKMMIREYQARDESGNLSSMCTDTVWFERIDLEDVTMPPNYTDDSSLVCQGPWDLDGDGYPDPEETGVPTFQTKEIIFSNADLDQMVVDIPRGPGFACGGYLNFSDTVTLRNIDIHADLDTTGEIKFLIFRHSDHQLLLETAPATYSDGIGATWKRSPTFNITLPPGLYDVGFITNVGHTGTYDLSSNSQNGITSIVSNPNFFNYDNPTAGGHASADCWVRLVGNNESFDLYPDPVDACNLQFDFTDREFAIPCGRKIMRTWEGMEWCAGSDRFIEFVQIINIVDTVPPVVEATVDEINKSTNLFACEANVVIPAANVTDNCNEVTEYVVSTNAPGVPVQVFTQPTTTNMILPIGTWDVVITAYDECNQNDGGSDTITVNVIDNTPPVAVCDQHTAVSLTTDGSARIYASTFDDGSHDECGPIDLMEVRRMGPQCDGTFDNFGPYVEFCCADIAENPIMVIFRVHDQAGNTNECMVEVEVQDKQPAIIEAPDDMTISCEFVFDENDLSIFGDVEAITDLSVLDDPSTDPRDSIFLDDPGDDISGLAFKGIDGYAYDNCDVTINVSSVIDINTCGQGTITRIFRAIGAGNVTQATDLQRITIVDYDPFNSRSIDWPDDVTLTNNCNLGNDITPDYLESIGHEGYPEYLDDECAQLARSYEDWFFAIDDPNDPACFKILRRWKVIDWCTYDQSEGAQPWENTQVIKVMNTIAPTFDLPCEDTTLISIQGDCSDRFVTLVQSATDDCTAEENLVYSYRIDLFDDGDFDINGSGSDASAEYPVGTHLVEWTVEDQCGNTNTCSYLFTIDDKKGPSPICRNLTVELMPVDTDGDGSPDTGMLDIWASDFDLKSYHACGFDISVSFSSDPLDTGLTLTCADVGVYELELWVHASNNTSAFCRTYAIVQANNGACGPGNEGPTFPIAGNISNPVSLSAMKNVEVELLGSTAMVETDDQGDYDFTPMPEGGNYTVKPKRDHDLLNGVSTFDILLMQQHILGLNELESGHKWVAADINNDKRITGADMIALRKAILGIEDEFPNNTSWRFIDTEFSFKTSDPLQESFPETYEINNLGSPMTNVNFDGLKIGDLSGNADTEVDGRSGSTLDFVVADKEVKAGETVRVAVTSANFDNIQGYQFTMSYDDKALSFMGIESGALEVNGNNIGDLSDQSALTMSWNAIEGKEVTEDEVLFTLVFEGRQQTKLSSSISLSDAVTVSEAYAYNNVMGTALHFRSTEKQAASFALYQNTPNPFTNTTIIGFNLPESAEATLSVFDVTGKELKVVEGSFAKGYNEVSLRRGELNATGVMYYRIESGDYTATKKMIVIE